MSRKSRTSRLPTMQDVAKRAGVSQTTVSFVVNNIPNKGIPEETRQRILDAIKQLGYRRNAFARSMRLKRSHIIGLVTDTILISPHAGQIIQGAQDAAKATGRTLLLANTGGDPELEKADLETLLEHQVEGIIYATMFHRVIEPSPLLYEIPTVLLDCYDEQRSLPSVAPDETGAGFSVVKILLQKGHQRIGFINSADTGPATNGRLAGYTQALAEARIPFRSELVDYGDSHADAGYACALNLLQQSPPPTAFFCFNDQMAMGVYQALQERKLRIPDDIAVMGFDNLEIVAAFLRPKLSTMELPHYDMGQWAVKHLIASLESQEESEPVQHTIACRYVERNSV